MISASAVYEELFSGAPHQPGRAYRAFDTKAAIGIQAFVDGQTRLPGLSLKVRRSEVPTQISLPIMRGALTSTHTEGESGASFSTFEIVAASPAFVDVFVELAAQLVGQLCNASSPATAAVLLARRLAAWARFFEARGSEGLSRSNELGLIGEMLCLQHLVVLVGADLAVRSWEGQTGSTHDFVCPYGAIESKLTTSGAPERFRISSERQLDDAPLNSLLMFAVVAQEVPGGPVSASGLVADLRRELGRADSAETAWFEDQLTASGYSEVDDGAKRIRLFVHREEFLRVTGDFPRLRPVEIRPGVSKVTYDVAWNTIAPYRISLEEVKSVFNG